jgi:hypothetical protein
MRAGLMLSEVSMDEEHLQRREADEEILFCRKGLIMARLAALMCWLLERAGGMGTGERETKD